LYLITILTSECLPFSCVNLVNGCWCDYFPLSAVELGDKFPHILCDVMLLKVTEGKILRAMTQAVSCHSLIVEARIEFQGCLWNLGPSTLYLLCLTDGACVVK
jgi:hypothetical protein